MEAEACFHDQKELACEVAMDADAADDLRKLKIVVALRQHVNGTGLLVATSTELGRYLKEAEITLERSTELFLLLTKWGFEQRSSRLEGPFPVRAWHIEAGRLDELEKELRAGIYPAES